MQIEALPSGSLLDAPLSQQDIEKSVVISTGASFEWKLALLRKRAIGSIMAPEIGESTWKKRTSRTSPSIC
jgi:hypothetical protein